MRLLPLLLAILSTVSAHKILVYNPKFAHSHINYMGHLADILEEKHRVTTLMPEIMPKYGNGTKSSKIIMIPSNKEARKAFETLSEGKVNYFTSNFINPLEIYKVGAACAKAFTAQCEDLLDSGEVEKLRERYFDVYIVETFDPCGIMLAHLIQPKSVIVISTTFLWVQQYDEIGLPKELSYNPSIYSNHLDVHSFWSRLKNVITDYVIAESNGPARLSAESLFKQRFGKEFPGLKEQTSHATWVFTNTEPIYDFATPTLSKVVPIPGLGARKPKPLDEYWTSVVSKRVRTVLISFGTFAPADVMPLEFKKSFAKMFTSFPHITFIMKYGNLEDEFAVKELSKVDNVVLTTWMPQNDLLENDRVVLFITHAGMGSVQELTLRGKPGLFIPLFGDQMRNAQMLELNGNGVHLDKADLGDANKFIAAVKEVLEEQKYATRAVETKQMLEGKPFSSEELLLKHVAFAGKFGEVTAMRPRSHEMTWLEYHNADVWFFLVSLFSLICLLLVFLFISFIRCIYAGCISSCRCSSTEEVHYTARRPSTSWTH